MQNHLSVNAASEMLERTRRTIKRALRHVPPDSHERGQPRWRLPKIIEALQTSGAPMTRPRHNSGTGNVFANLNADLENDRQTLPMFDALNQAFEEMEAERSLAKRRKMAISRIPEMLVECIEAYRVRCVASGEFIDGDSRGDCMFSHLMDRFQELCRWTHDEVFEYLLVSEEDDEA
jgi:hypothetical protein